MKRAIQLALVVAVCLVALAQASVIYWGPAKRLCDDDKSWTSGNNTWAVTGTGDTAEAVFVRRISNVTSVWFARSTNRGGQWLDPTQIDNNVTVDSASSPSIVKLNTDGHGEQLVVAYLAWRSKKTEPFTETSYVFCRGSTDGGLTWGTSARCTSSLYRLTQLSAAAADADGDWPPHFELAWRLPGNGGDYLFNRRGHLSSGNVNFDGDPIQFVNYVYGAGAPSIYTTPWLHAGCAWQEYYVDAPGEAYDRRNGNYWSWPDVMLQIGGVSGRTGYGYPSISHTILQGGSKIQELVAYNVRPGNIANPPQRIGSAHRELTLNEYHAVTCSTTWSCPNELYPGYNLDSLFRPNVWSSGDTFYMLFTGFPRENDSRKVYCTATNNGGTSWMPSNSLDKADSASICVSMGNGYCVYTHSGTTYHRALARFGRVAYGPPHIAEDGSNNRRRLARVPGTGVLHRVYVVEDYINYERSDENGDIIYQDAPDYGDAPSLALSPGGAPIVAYRRDDTIFSAAMNADSDWTIKTIFAAPSSQHLGPPSLGVFQSADADDRIGNCCFPVYDTVSTNSMILFVQFDTSGSVVLDTISFNSGKLSDSSACLVVGASDTVSVCYNSGDSVYMKKLVFPPTSMTRPDAWSAASLVDSGVVVSTRHAAVEKVGSRLWVTFSQKRLRNDTTVWAI